MKNILFTIAGGVLLLSVASCSTADKDKVLSASVSGIYPKLAYYNNEGECGTGAVVPWANRLWVVTYGPHCPKGSSDKLYEITPDFRQIVHAESVGGTPANRMIHKESNQLFIGPYVIDAAGKVRTIPYSAMYGRHTGNARHLTDPQNKIYYATMEEGFYEVDVHSLSVKELFPDGNRIRQSGDKRNAGPINDLLPGVHGKGAYSGQGKLYFTNNGEGTVEALRKFDVEAGVLGEWDGKNWKVVRRNQFVDVTGPGGIEGNKNPKTDPIWTMGFDYKSIILGVRDAERGWAFYRLPKASHSYDGAHGWNTEWPRIRNVGTESQPDYMMTMHGQFWTIPADFSYGKAAGIRPRSAYLKVIGDFARWNNQLVFGCDDTAKNEFMNTRRAKGKIGGPGQSNSNVWFTSLNTPDDLGPSTAEGAVWAKETVKANAYSEPFLFAGWNRRCAWIQNDANAEVTYTFETDKDGKGNWEVLKSVTVDAGKAANILFEKGDRGEWIRVKTNRDTHGTVSFSYTGNDDRTTAVAPMFKGLTPADKTAQTGGLLYSLGKNRRALGLLATTEDNGKVIETGYYEMGDSLTLVKKDAPETAAYMRKKFAIPHQIVKIESGSVLMVDNSGRRWRLPLGNKVYETLTDNNRLRICREVATERDLFSCMGTFYELPAENADGYAKIRPICTHNFQINDYASYRGMLLMTGISPEKAKGNPHVILSQDGKAAVWAGVIDDLWQLGKPIGKGGPWKDTQVKKGIPSDPYLIGFYDRKTLSLSHKSDKTINIRVEVDPTGNGDWMEYSVVSVKPGEKVDYTFPKSFQARWIRFVSDADTEATAWLEYK